MLIEQDQSCPFHSDIAGTTPAGIEIFYREKNREH